MRRPDYFVSMLEVLLFLCHFYLESFGSEHSCHNKENYIENSVRTPFDIPFLRNTEIGKKTAICTRTPVNRLVPKVI